MSTQKGVVASIGPDTAAGCALKAYINSANSNAVYAIANLGTRITQTYIPLIDKICLICYF